MKEKPNHINEREVLETVKREFCSTASEITFLPVGNEAGVCSFRVKCDGADELFVKVDARSGVDPDVFSARIEVAKFAHDFGGVPEAVSPIFSSSGSLVSTSLRGHRIIAMPFVEGTPAREIEGTMGWRKFGDILRRLHGVRVPASLVERLPKENFETPRRWLDAIERIDTKIGSGQFSDQLQTEAAAWWLSNRGKIGALLERSSDLGKRVKLQGLPMVLCHSDIHTSNLLVTASGELRVIDWDDLMIAPRERDLVFTINPGKQTIHGREFLEGYSGGENAFSELALRWYQIQWTIQEIGDNGSRVFLLTKEEIGDGDRAVAFKELKEEEGLQ